MRGVLVFALLVTTAACGRVGFDPSGGGPRGDDAGDDTPLGGVRSIAAGANVSCAVLDDRSLWCWGDATSNAIGAPVTEPFVPGTRVGSDNNWVEVAVGDVLACAVKTDGSLWCWGDAYAFGGGDVGTLEVAPVRVDGPADWSAIAIGAKTCGIHQDRSLTCFGSGVSAGTAIELVPGHRFTHIAGGRDAENVAASCAVEDTGALWCWGYDSYGIEYPPAPRGGDTWTEVSAAYGGWLGVHADGTLWHGSLDFEPVLLSNEVGFTSPALGAFVGNKSYGCAVKDGALWCFGDNHLGQQGDTHDVERAEPELIDAGATFAQVASGPAHTCASRNGVLACTGLGTRGELGDGVVRWSRTSAVPGEWIAVDAGAGFGVARAVDGNTTWWGVIGQIYDAQRSSPDPALIFDPTMRDVAATRQGALGVRDDGTLWLWGRFLDDVDRTTPVQIGTSTAWADVDGGADDACALQSDGTLWCWGWNYFGTVGDGTMTTRTEPVHVGAATWTQVSVGEQGACGIQADDSLWCWGANIGDAQGSSSTTPTKVDMMSWARVSVGTWLTCAITIGGSLQCWEQFDMFGYPSRPTAVDAGTDWAQVSAGWYHACAIKTDGSLWCWGQPAGYVGDGPIGEPHWTPQRIGTDTDWAEVTAGEDATCARRTSGALSCWGTPTSIGNGLAWSTGFVPVRRVGTL